MNKICIFFRLKNEFNDDRRGSLIYFNSTVCPADFFVGRPKDGQFALKQRR